MGETAGNMKAVTVDGVEVEVTENVRLCSDFFSLVMDMGALTLDGTSDAVKLPVTHKEFLFYVELVEREDVFIEHRENEDFLKRVLQYYHPREFVERVIGLMGHTREEWRLFTNWSNFTLSDYVTLGRVLKLYHKSFGYNKYQPTGVHVHSNFRTSLWVSKEEEKSLEFSEDAECYVSSSDEDYDGPLDLEQQEFHLSVIPEAQMQVDPSTRAEDGWTLKAVVHAAYLKSLAAWDYNKEEEIPWWHIDWVTISTHLSDQANAELEGANQSPVKRKQLKNRTLYSYVFNNGSNATQAQNRSFLVDALAGNYSHSRYAYHFSGSRLIQMRYVEGVATDTIPRRDEFLLKILTFLEHISDAETPPVLLGLHGLLGYNRASELDLSNDDTMAVKEQKFLDVWNGRIDFVTANITVAILTEQVVKKHYELENPFTEIVRELAELYGLEGLMIYVRILHARMRAIESSYFSEPTILVNNVEDDELENLLSETDAFMVDGTQFGQNDNGQEPRVVEIIPYEEKELTPEQVQEVFETNDEYRLCHIMIDCILSAVEEPPTELNESSAPN